MKNRVINFSQYSSIKIGPTVEVVVIESEDELETPGYLIGGANNLLVSPNPGKLKMLGKSFDFIKIKGEYLYIGAATKTGKILSFAKKNDIAGFEFVAKLPGTLGGMLAMNAGVKQYEIFNILDAVKINGKWIKKEAIEHDYRFAKLGGIATEARFPLKKGYNEALKNELLLLRKNQPKEPSAGSAFKNPKGDFAGRLIEAVKLKGKRIGNMAFSNIHANFLVNLGGGKFEDAIKLLGLAKKRVFEEFGIKLVEEIKII